MYIKVYVTLFYSNKNKTLFIYPKNFIYIKK